MGYSTYFYVGAYLEIQADKIPRSDGPFCRNEKCPRYDVRMSGTFCSSCAQPLASKTLMYNATLDDLLPYEFEDELSNPDGYHSPLIAIGNKRKPLPDDLDVGTLPFAVEIDPGIAETFKANLQENYADVIAELRKKATVEIKFGCLGYRW